MSKQENINLCFIIQARLGSTRLPGKIMMPFYKANSIFDLLIEKLQKTFPEIPIILATSEKEENDILVQRAHEKSLKVYRGDEEDVLRRFINAAEEYKFKNIIRICSDNPFLNMKELRRLIDFLINHKFQYDYVSYCVNCMPSIKTHFGFWTEFVRLDALKKANSLIVDNIYREHVTNYIYEHSKLFDIYFLKVSPALENRNDIRMTLDTLEDFKVLKSVYQELVVKYKDSEISVENIVNYLDSRESYKEHMQQQIERNSK